VAGHVGSSELLGINEPPRRKIGRVCDRIDDGGDDAIA
jgi:hypothetical protein